MTIAGRRHVVRAKRKMDAEAKLNLLVTRNDDGVARRILHQLRIMPPAS